VRVAEVRGGFDEWRAFARRLLRAGTPPDEVEWVSDVSPQATLAIPTERERRPAAIAPRVPERFLRLARVVAYHRDPGRWNLLYRALWRLTAGERHLLALATDPEVHALFEMARAVRRSAHKMKAFVRFRAVHSAADQDAVYVAWFEPAHPVVEGTAPFFARRFRSMRWSILTPDRCAHWDRHRLQFTPGVTRGSAPGDDELEELWCAYYAGAFNPARLNTRLMRAEMPKHYWRNLPESRLIAELSRNAPRRTAEMLARSLGPAEALPAELQSRGEPAPAVTPGWHPVYDPGADAARQRMCAAGHAAPRGLTTPGGTRILVGVAGWTDPTLTASDAFYPREAVTAEHRLRHYASHYPIVEVDATYYSLPTRGMAAAWARRTPDHFVFDVKAHGLMTGHAAEVRRLPDWLRRELPREALAAGRVYGRDLPATLLEEVWRRFLSALDPLRAAGKLGAVLLQYPRWFQPGPATAAALADVRGRLGDVPGAIELRHHTWMAGRVRDRTLGLLADLDLTYVVVDGPQGLASSMPPIAAVTSSRLAVVRLHGRRVETWERRNHAATERYRYLYDDAEIAEHLRKILELSEQKASALHIIYNNCHGNYAVTNAAELTYLLLSRTSPRSRSAAGTDAASPWARR
jgi:probable DNA metabolism protein